ncbi:hypothetical protein TNCV_146591 [Trichonephila clavipes]|nr:hypothetical protein TNCV_146591 [Trichonephila clavipes]
MAGLGSLVVKVTDSWLEGQEFEPGPLKILHVEANIVKSIETHTHRRLPIGVVWKLEERMPAQMLLLSLDHGSKLRGPSPIALMQLYDVTLIFTLTHSLFF